MATDLTWTEVHRESWDVPRPAQHGAPAGTDYFTAVYTRATWPDNGSKYAGRTYESCRVWIGNGPGVCHVVDRSSQYPAERSPLDI